MASQGAQPSSSGVTTRSQQARKGQLAATATSGQSDKAAEEKKLYEGLLEKTRQTNELRISPRACLLICAPCARTRLTWVQAVSARIAHCCELCLLAASARITAQC